MKKKIRIFPNVQQNRSGIYPLITLLLLGFLLFITNFCKNEVTPAQITCNGSGYYYIDSSTIMCFPNAFTPNGTGPRENETYGGVGEWFTNFSLTIKDLSGTTLFHDTIISNHWDGKNLNGKVVEGYYKAYISFKNVVGATINLTMDITLFVNNVSIHNSQNCKFGDMINPKLGFIYLTHE